MSDKHGSESKSQNNDGTFRVGSSESTFDDKSEGGHHAHGPPSSSTSQVIVAAPSVATRQLERCDYRAPFRSLGELCLPRQLSQGDPGRMKSTDCQ